MNLDSDVTISELYYKLSQLADLIVQQNISMKETNEVVFYTIFDKVLQNKYYLVSIQKYSTYRFTLGNIETKGREYIL